MSPREPIAVQHAASMGRSGDAMVKAESTVEMVAEALRGIVFPRGRRNDLPLLRWEVVNRHARYMGAPEGPDGRWAALRGVLASLVLLGRPQQPTPKKGADSDDADGPLGPHPEPSTLSNEQQAWEAVFLHYFADTPLTQVAVARALKLDKRTNERRLTEGRRLLAARLVEREIEAQRHLQAVAVAGAPSVRVSESAPSYGVLPLRAGTEPERAQAALTVLWDAVVRGVDLPSLTPDELEAIARHPATTIDEYLLKRVAAWQHRPTVDQRIVQLALWLDSDGEPGRTPAVETERVFTSLASALADLDDRLVVVVGEPGSGKTTLLEHLEQETAIAALRGEIDTVPFVLRLDSLPQLLDPDPAFLDGWLRQQWSVRCGRLPTLDTFLADGQLLLLLDGLNEIPHRDFSSYVAYVRQWRSCAWRVLDGHPGNRVVFTCRTLDYTTPLSSSERSVPRLEIKPLDDERLQQFLAMLLPDLAQDVWAQVTERSLREVLRVPYNLRLYAEAVGAEGARHAGLAGIFARFVRSKLRKEIEDGVNPVFAPGIVLSKRDYQRFGQTRRWPNEWELPEEGPLIPALSTLAEALHDTGRQQAADVTGLDPGRCIQIIDHPEAENVLDAARSLGLLADRLESNTLAFSHPQMQAFFLARRLAKDPRVDRVAREWRAADVTPSLDDVLNELPATELLPLLDQTGWEEPTMLAAEMTGDPDTYLEAMSDVNLALAGRCAAIEAVAARVSPERIDSIRQALLARSRDRLADLRDRIPCGRALGVLGDPRLKRMDGAHGPYLLPPMVMIPGGTYPIGDDEPITTAVGLPDGHVPRHTVTLATFELGMLPVTRAEWALFMAAGGYEYEQWWDTDEALAWQRGATTGRALREADMDIARHFRAHPEKLDELHRDGGLSKRRYDELHERLLIVGEAEEAWLLVNYPDGPVREPRQWRDVRFNQPSQPVVGIGWYEARAYCLWLSAQTDRMFRLPTEVEWEAAARGAEGRRYPYGNHFNRLSGNTSATRIRRPSPVGIFPEGDTPEGISDLSGNILEWTSSAWGESDQVATFAYPYRADDGREDPHVSYRIRRVTRGGSSFNDGVCAMSMIRGITSPGIRVWANGFRLAADYGG